ncbi:hypothetical protein PVK06_041092 [Gossypium arboreum]|uniref:Uncharacterized protein n=1 Tax=Gossypium arboreum TaxID=29729 RepID=A0ABR0N788_GOSAR|nr:hypothetical protein PVK06_041092 [Gossypium arboreum]
MNTPICLTVEDFGNLLHLPSGGNSNEKGLFNQALFIPSCLASKTFLHDRVFHLILTWNLRLIMKHAKLRNTDYWWLDTVQNNRLLDLVKAIKRGLNTNITLPHGTYLSYIFRQLGINTLGYSTITSNHVMP